MKIYFGRGEYLEPDEGLSNTPHHRRIVQARRIPNTLNGMSITLECGHEAMIFGRLIDARGMVLCALCRDGAEKG